MTKNSRKNEYRNVFVELGYKEEEVSAKLKEIVNTVFFGNEAEKIYYEIEDMAYVMDTGNLDVRTEGMSYAMMVFVQLDMQEQFDRIWRYTKKYMYMSTGINKGYFAWSVGMNGEKNAYGPAPDGEEFFALALFFAGNRWGNGEGIFNYKQEAKELLSVCIHKGEGNDEGEAMWNAENKLIKFIPNVEFSDPSYHLPHFYELFALWSNEEDHNFWFEAAKASRSYIKKSCHQETGLAAEYATYEGEPYQLDGHHRFYSDAYRVAGNIGLYHEWNGDDLELCQCNERLQKFFKETVKGYQDYVYEINGTKIDEKVLHPVGLIATNAMGSLATKGKYSDECVHEFYKTPLRTGDRRYYDNFLYIFAFMALSGQYKIWY